MMFKRIAIVGSAVALAVLVLFLAMRAAPAPKPIEHKAIDGPLDPSAFTGIDPAAGDSQINPRGRADKYRINRYSDSDQLIELYGDRIKPLPKGIAEVTAPGARIHLERHRVLQITADHGTIVAPDNHPQSGRFTGNVVITLFESDPSRAADLSDASPDVALRARLGDSRFDLDLGMIESNDPVHVTSPQVDFRGTGLTLSYNELRRRIDRLEIHRGRSLRFKPEALDRPDQPQDDNNTVNDAPTNHARPREVPDQTKIQRYRATFNQRVHIRSPQAEIDADRFDVVFNFRAQDTDRNRATGASSAGPKSSLIPIPNHPHAATAFAVAAAATAQTGRIESMAPVGPEDVIITWTGPLVVEPHTDNLDALDDPKAVLVEMAGSPLRVQTPGNDLVTAARLDYLTTRGRFRAFADPRHPVQIISPSLGKLTAREMEFDRTTVVGRVVGPGTLSSNKKGEGLDDEVARSLGGLTIAWQENLDLTFTPPGSTASASNTTDDNPFSRFAALDSATFHQAVRVNSDDLDLGCDRLVVTMDRNPNLPAAPQSIHAMGSVQLTARNPTPPNSPAPQQPNGPQQPDAELDLSADELRIDLKRDADHRALPDTITATGSVTAQHQGRSIHTEDLQLALNTTAEHENPITTVRSVVAERGVRIDIQDPGVSVTASRLVADLEADQIELFAGSAPDTLASPPPTPPVNPLMDWPVGVVTFNPPRPAGPPEHPPARIAFPQGHLQADYIVMHHRTQAMYVPGPGTLVFATGDNNGNDGAENREPIETDTEPPDHTPTLIDQAIAAARKTKTRPDQHGSASVNRPPNAPPDDQPPADVQLTWTEAMHLDNRTGVAHFIGDVRARSDSGDETAELSAQNLRLEFTRLNEKHDPATAPPDPTTPTATPVDRLAHGKRTIRTATARDGVTLLTQRFMTDAQQQVITRLRLQGPYMVFDHAAEQAQIVGAGTLLVEDYREPSGATDDKKRLGAHRRVKFTGRGPTLFRWSKQMTVDAFHNDINLLGNVQMIHRPADGEAVQLDCRRLLADLKPTGGLPTWLAGRPKQPAIQAIHADSDVRLTTSDRTVRTDHLIYTGYDNRVVLRAQPGRLTTLQDHGEPYAHSAESFQWDLQTDRIEIVKPTSPWVPVRTTRKD